MERIFVQIASYRDAELPRTIESCLQRASSPESLRFGICWQYDETTITDLDPYVPRNGFRIDPVYFLDSKGCCWARNRVNRLYEGEEYTLQIDAHTRFAEDWDKTLIGMLRSVDSGKPIISTYPPPYNVVKGEDVLLTNRGIQKLRLERLRRDLTTKQSTTRVSHAAEPGSSPLLAAGMIFTLGEFCREVEYDPGMYFNGEEISIAARAYTSGYDFFYPNKDVLWHLYKHTMPLHWSDHGETQSEMHREAMARLRKLLLGEQEELGKYGLGGSRTLEEFEAYAGVDFRAAATRPRTPMRFHREIELDCSEIETRDDYDYWVFTLLDEEGEELYRSDITEPDILDRSRNRIDVNAMLPDRPCRYMLWPYSSEEGYLRKYVYDLELDLH